MIVNNIENIGDSRLYCARLDEPLEAQRAGIVGIDGRDVSEIIAPRAHTCKLAPGHDLNGVDTKPLQMLQSSCDGDESSWAVEIIIIKRPHAIHESQADSFQAWRSRHLLGQSLDH